MLQRKEPETLNADCNGKALLPLDQNECLVPHLKDLVHIFLEPEAQRHGMAYRAIFCWSNYPKLIS